MFDFSNQVVLITGAAGALGRVVARSFQGAGARLALLDSRSDRLPEIFADVVGSSDHLFCHATDLTDSAAVTAAVTQVVNHFRRIDVLLNIAGGFRAGLPLHETPEEDWNLMFDLNARSVFNMCRAVVPHMLAQKSGKIVNVAARAALSGGPNMAPYVASKSAVIRLTESMAAELREANINVNCVLPSAIDTPQNRRDMPNADYSHWVPPQDLAAVMMFLASDAARAINGAALPVYGRG